MQMQNQTRFWTFAAVMLALGWSASALAVDSLNGAGATFPYPLYSKWFSEYKKANPGIEINYQSIGSGGGIRQLLDRTIDFGASDAPMTDDQLAKSQVPILHIPTVLGAVVVTYNIPGVTSSIQLSAETLTDIFLGKIKTWDEPRIMKENPGVKFPSNTPILLAYRSDGSGTTAVFTDYLAKVSPEWKEKVGTGTSVKWPVGLGGKGNEGVTGLVKQMPGAIGYVELVYAEKNKMPFASIKNAAGKFVVPSPETVSAAAAGSLKAMPKDFRISITNATGKDSYPISSFTYLLVYQKMDKEKAELLTKFLDWAMTIGQTLAKPLSYAPLPKSMVAQVKSRIKEISAK